MTNEPESGYYKQARVECIDIIEDLGLSFSLGNALKYLWRCGYKHDDPLDDLRKARYYLDREIARLEQGESLEPIIIPAIKPQTVAELLGLSDKTLEFLKQFGTVRSKGEYHKDLEP